LSVELQYGDRDPALEPLDPTILNTKQNVSFIGKIVFIYIKLTALTNRIFTNFE
jgi:hypothetical protein